MEKSYLIRTHLTAISVYAIDIFLKTRTTATTKPRIGPFLSESGKSITERREICERFSQQRALNRLTQVCEKISVFTGAEFTATNTEDIGQ